MIAAAVLAGVAVAGLVAGTAALLANHRSVPIERALAPYQVRQGAGRPTRQAGTGPLLESSVLQRAVREVGRLAARRGMLQTLGRKLEHAESQVRPAEALFLYGVVLVLGTAIAALVGHLPAALVVAGVLALAPWVALDLRARSRERAFASQLPDMLQLLATTLRSGFSLLQGLDTVSRQLADPLGEAMRKVVAEARLGRPLADALADLADRVDSRDFAWVVTAIAIQREVGGNLAELLDIVAETMTARSAMRREVRTLTAEGRLSAIILAVLPIAIGVFVYIVNPGYLSPLFHSTLGKIVFFGAIVLAVFGVVWMQRIVDIEV